MGNDRARGKFISDANSLLAGEERRARETLGAVLYRSADPTLDALCSSLHAQSARALWRQLGQAEDLERLNRRNFMGILSQGTLIGLSSPSSRIDKAKTRQDRKELHNNEKKRTAPNLRGGTRPGRRAVSRRGGSEPEANAVRGATEAGLPRSAGPTQATSLMRPSLITLTTSRNRDAVGEILTAERVPTADKLSVHGYIVIATPAILAVIPQHTSPKSHRSQYGVVSTSATQAARFESRAWFSPPPSAKKPPVLATFSEEVPTAHDSIKKA